MKTVNVCVWLLTIPSALTGQQSHMLSMNIESAVDRAVVVSPLVRVAEGTIVAARGERAEAIWPFSGNPSIEYQRVRRRQPSAEVTDLGWRFGQSIEVAGQAFVRAGAAGRRIAAAEAGVEDSERSAGLTARYSYLNLYRAERRVDLTATNAELAEQLADLARRQLDAGEINVLEANTAALEAARARSEAMRAEGDLATAQAALGQELALGQDTVATTDGLPSLPAVQPGVDRVLELALERRPDLRAARFSEDASGRTVSAVRMRSIPNLELGVFNGREDGSDDLLGFSVGVVLPVFRRAQAEVGAARAAHIAAQAATDATQRAIRAEIVGGLALYAAAQRAMGRLADELLASAEQNSELAAQAFEQGELSVADVVVFRATALSTQLEYLDAVANAYGAWFQLATAIGIHPDEFEALTGGAQ